MGICYNPRVFTPARERLSLTEWHALQAFLVEASRIDPAAFTFSYPSPLDAAVAILRTLKADATEFINNVLPRAHSMGVSLADYGRDATETFKVIVNLLDASGTNVKDVLSRLDDLKARAAANAVAATSLFGELAAYLERATGTVSALDAVVKGSTVSSRVAELESLNRQIDTLTAQRAGSVNDDSHGKNTWWIDTQLSNLNYVKDELAANRRIKSLNDQLQAALATARPSLEHVEGAWSAVAQELGTVIDDAQVAGSDALQRQQCLAEIALTDATEAWNDVANDARSFVDAFYVKLAAG